MMGWQATFGVQGHGWRGPRGARQASRLHAWFVLARSWGPAGGVPEVLRGPRLWSQKGRQPASRERCDPQAGPQQGLGPGGRGRGSEGSDTHVIFAGRGWPHWT